MSVYIYPLPYYVKTKSTIIEEHSMIAESVRYFKIVVANETINWQSIINIQPKIEDIMKFRRVFIILETGTLTEPIISFVLNRINQLGTFVKPEIQPAFQVCKQYDSIMTAIQDLKSVIIHYFYIEEGYLVYNNLYLYSNHITCSILDFKERFLILENHVIVNQPTEEIPTGIYGSKSLKISENTDYKYYFCSNEYILPNNYVMLFVDSLIFWIKCKYPIIGTISNIDPVYVKLDPNVLTDNDINNIRSVFTDYAFYDIRTTKHGMYAYDTVGNLMFIGAIEDHILNI